MEHQGEAFLCGVSTQFMLNGGAQVTIIEPASIATSGRSNSVDLPQHPAYTETLAGVARARLAATSSPPGDATRCKHFTG